jgi:hypothetical protein
MSYTRDQADTVDNIVNLKYTEYTQTKVVMVKILQ